MIKRTRNVATHPVQCNNEPHRHNNYPNKHFEIFQKSLQVNIRLFSDINRGNL